MKLRAEEWEDMTSRHVREALRSDETPEKFTRRITKEVQDAIHQRNSQARRIKGRGKNQGKAKGQSEPLPRTRY